VMAKGFWIGRVDVSNPEAYQNYVRANAVPFAAFGARFLVRGATPVLETPGRAARDAAAARRLWALSEELTGLTMPVRTP